MKSMCIVGLVVISQAYVAQGQAYFSTTGPCIISSDGLCFSDGPGNHANNERCTISVLRNTTLRVESFVTETFYDYLTVAGTRYSGTSGPTDVAVTTSSAITWQSDFSIVRDGFTICSSETAAPTPLGPWSEPFDLVITHPAADSTFTTGQAVIVQWVFDPNTTVTSFELGLYAEGSSTPSLVLSQAVSIETGQFLLTFPGTLPSGNYWFAAVDGSTMIGYGPYPNNGSLGSSHVVLTFDATAACTAHSNCSTTQYCDQNSICAICDECTRWYDAIDYVCPSNCGGAPAFVVGSTIPDTTEAVAAGELDDFLVTACPDFNALVNLTSPLISVDPDNTEGYPRLMSTRLRDKLVVVAQTIDGDSRFAGLQLRVHAAYKLPPTNISDASLHHAGRAAELSIVNVSDPNSTVDAIHLEHLGRAAAFAGLDFVKYASATHVYVSVIPDGCRTPLDLGLLLDGSGSIEMTSSGGAVGNFEYRVLGFAKAMVPFFSYGPNANNTRMSVTTFSSETATQVNFDLAAHTSSSSILGAIDTIPYPTGSTATSVGVNLLRTQVFNETNGMRSLSLGIPRVAVIITDGQSTSGFAPGTEAALLRGDPTNALVIAIGVGNGYSATELESMASGSENVYTTKSFDRIPAIVDRISYAACQSRPVVNCSSDTIGEVGQCEFAFFQSPFTSDRDFVVEVTTVSGEVHVYVDNSSNPGPFRHLFRDETSDTLKSVVVTRAAGETDPLFFSVKGVGTGTNSFTLRVFSNFFEGDSNVTVGVPADTAVGSQVYTPPAQVGLTYTILSGNDMSPPLFDIDSTTGVISTVSTFDHEGQTEFLLRVNVVNASFQCLNGIQFVTVSLTNIPTAAPTSVPTASPSASPSSGPTLEPTASPSGSPTFGPTVAPTGTPTGVPSTSPSSGPSFSPTAAPSSVPSVSPTESPTAVPSVGPTSTPTAAPTGIPTATPSAAPTATPTASPSAAPTASPTATPSAAPTSGPTEGPTVSPSAAPSATPTASPTAAPTGTPTATPTASPSSSPTASPTAAPSASPTASPSATPTSRPTEGPTFSPTASPTAPPTASPTSVPSTVPSSSPTASPTATATASPTATPSVLPTATPSATPTAGPTEGPTFFPTATPTASPSPAPTAAPSAFPTTSPTAGPTASPSTSPTATPSAAPTATPTASPSGSPTATPTGTPTSGPTEGPTFSPTASPSATPTATPSENPTASPTTSPTATPSATPTGSPSASPTSLPTGTPTGSPTARPSEGPTFSPSAAPSATPTAIPTAAPTAAPTATPTGNPSATPTASPTATPTGSPTATPTGSPTSGPTEGPTFAPTAAPSAAPTAAPTASPTATPSVSPSAAPSAEPTASPTPSPTGSPTATPSGAPTASPSEGPTFSPTAAPSASPTARPSATPSAAPTSSPTASPSATPSSNPTAAPSVAPTAVPTAAPTGVPTEGPTFSPTGAPTSSPTPGPSAAPTFIPTVSPTSAPSVSPTASPSASPSAVPTAEPTAVPTARPTNGPTVSPTATPTATPTGAPTSAPTSGPTASPTALPSGSPTATPTSSPSAGPTNGPTITPTASPTSSPTATPTVSPSAVPTETPTALPTVGPTASPSATPTARPTNSPSAAPTESPTATPSFAPIASPTASPTTTPSAAPTASPSSGPTATPSASPSARPSFSPTASPSASPSTSPSSSPTFAPSAQPTIGPTATICPPWLSSCTDEGGGNIPITTYSFPCCGDPVVVAEDTGLGEIVLVVQAVADNPTVPFTMSYTIEPTPINRRVRRQATTVPPSATPNPTLPFEMAELSGELSVSGTLDFESEPSYQLLIKAVAPDATVMGAVNITINISGVPCPEGSWSPSGTVPCNVHSECFDGLIELSPPTQFSDRECGEPIELTPGPDEEKKSAAGGDEAGAATGVIIPIIVLLCLLLLLIGFVAKKRKERVDEKDVAEAGLANQFAAELQTHTLNPVHAAVGAVPGMSLGPAAPNFNTEDYEEPVDVYPVAGIAELGGSEYVLAAGASEEYCIAQGEEGDSDSVDGDAQDVYHMAGEVPDEGYELAQGEDSDSENEGEGAAPRCENDYALGASAPGIQLEDTYEFASSNGPIYDFGLEGTSSTDAAAASALKTNESDTIYATGDGRDIDDVYACASAFENKSAPTEALYDTGAAVNNGSDIYDTANATDDMIYDVGAAGACPADLDATYEIPVPMVDQEAVYDVGAAVARARDEYYECIGADAVYDVGAAPGKGLVPEPTYDISNLKGSQDDLPPVHTVPNVVPSYDIGDLKGSQDDLVSEVGSTYDRSKSVQYLTLPGVDAVYDLGATEASTDDDVRTNTPQSPSELAIEILSAAMLNFDDSGIDPAKASVQRSLVRTPASLARHSVTFLDDVLSAESDVA
eukprot:m.286473 g.286473  ORF g.286473 m.286473 type:complete len:2385 (+) comp16212_c0_seq1:103-7257(+)